MISKLQSILKNAENNIFLLWFLKMLKMLTKIDNGNSNDNKFF